MKPINFILNLLFPKRCMFCNGVMGFIKECDRCDHAGQRLAREMLRVDSNYIKSLDGLTSLYRYEGIIKQCISRIKFADDRLSGNEISRHFAENYPSELFPNVDFVMCVPDFKTKEYALSHNLLTELVNRSNIPLFNGVIKTRETQKQHDLNKSERLQNLKKAFSCNQKEIIVDKNILIVDDVLTTGSTVNEIAALLKCSGAVKVYAYTFAATPEVKYSSHDRTYIVG